MNICPITYEEIPNGSRYSEKGLRSLSPMLKELHDLPLSAEEQRKEAVARASKMSIQGVQAKLSAALNVKDGLFEVTDKGGRYILKPQSGMYSQLPENEDLTMRLAETIDLKVPLHGLIYCADKTMTYFIKRFDRAGKADKLAVEDFAQLAGQTRDTKYDWTMEKLVPIIDERCTFPAVEKVKLLKLTLFNYLVGNEDMHLKNFSVICREDKVELSPSYDLINTTISVPATKEELALPLHGKKARLSLEDFRDYFALQRLGIRRQIFDGVLEQIKSKYDSWTALIDKSFLTDTMKKKYGELINERRKALNI